MKRLRAAWLAFRKPETVNWPTLITVDGARKLDHLPAIEAVLKAWTEPGSNPDWHRQKRRQVHAAMPLLGRALNRVTERTYRT